MKSRCKECRLHVWHCPHCHGDYCYNVFCEINTFEIHRNLCKWFFQKSKAGDPIYQARMGTVMGSSSAKAYRGPKFGSGG